MIGLDYILERLIEHPAVTECASHLGESDGRFALADRARPALIAALARKLGRPMLVLAGGAGKAEQLIGELHAYLPADSLFHYRAHETFPWERVKPDPEGVGSRLAALAALQSSRPCVAVASVAALMRRIAPPAAGIASLLHVSVGDSVDVEDVVARLVSMGYERTHVVEARGEFALRGGILDVFSSTSQYPVRIEFFGDEVESIRRFLVSSQQSVAPEREVLLFACREVRLDDAAVGRATSRLEKKARNDARTREDLERLVAGHFFPGVESYLPALYGEPGTLGDYLPGEAVVVLDEPKKIHDDALRHLARVASAKAGTHARDHFLSARQLDEVLGGRRRLDLFLIAEAGGLAEYSLDARPIEPALGHPDRIVSRILALSATGAAVIVVVRDEGHASRLRELLADGRIPVVPAGESLGDRLVFVGVGSVSRGFVARDAGIALVGHEDLFPPAGRARVDRQTSAVEAARMLSGLRAGDYVVHESHGVAVYGGMESREVDGRVRDYLILTYAERDRLFVPVEQIRRVSRYVGPDGKAPKITRLSTNDWARATQKARASAKKLAFDLAQLYAQRSMIEGHAFSADTVWQRELEDGFAFEETPDQLAAVAAVKSDMERAVPMDRLVCGDVGYGKTEVAIRAAAKAVLDDRQVIVLAPTTILAQQHYATFCERFAPFPVRVEMLSRFRSHAQQCRILGDLALGKVDILIGTHRLLQKDVVPKDLGLVVVDEEQRFGVGHKEHLKNMRKTVDVLTLTATPIPRTLQMSVAGVRDLSVIDTPPEDRLEVATEVGAYDRDRVREAIARELDRDGQVFYVYNRVQTIAAVARRVEALAPDARVAVAHGQMHEHELEKVMRAFLANEIDVLVCTTIIESGIDIPTANTLIVEGAERLGLGQLYQLRGRVGRSHHRAYAYFFFSDEAVLTHAAMERLSTIRQFTQLGSGLKIAMRDLEIRGAGNILGPEQHGHMAAVGFELYCQMLRDAIADAQGEPVQPREEAKMSLPIEAYLPATYVGDEDLRVEAYRQVADALDPEGVLLVARALADRFGPPPAPVANLLEVARLRLIAGHSGVREVVVSDATLRIDFDERLRPFAAELAKRRGGRLVRGVDRLLLPIRRDVDVLAVTTDVLNDIMAVVDLRRD